MKTTRLTVLILCAFAVGVLGSFTTSVEAAGKSCTYFSDASHTTVVGRHGKDCCNNTVSWGQKTQYSECGGCFVCSPPPAD